MIENPLSVIQGLLDQKSPAMIPLVEELIAKHKLKLRVGPNFTLADISETTDAWLARLVSHNTKIAQLKEDVLKLAKAPEDKDQLFTVLVTGETGTGKELVARALHGDRKGKFHAINCAGLPIHLIESEMFGHVRGAFTDAVKDKEGLMESAKDGTLFMDEIGELPLEVQAKFLRAIQEKKIRKVGSTASTEVNCRIVCATHRDIQTMSEQDRFRLDLYARISTYELHIPSLHERREDIIPIILSMDGGEEFIKAMQAAEKPIHMLDLGLNVRSLQQHVKRYKMFNRLPVSQV